jgi:hypothetical protein
MNKDFHLYGTYMAARDAGYDEKDAAQLAMSAQMVDDFMPEFSAENHTVTPMISKAMKAAFSQAEKLDISNTWMPFHFIPKHVYDSKGNFQSFACGYGKPIKNITARLHSNSSLERIGITLHVLADSFAHQEFCGVTVNEIDVVENIQIFLGKEYPGLNTFDHVPVWLQWLFPKTAYFGHGSAGHVPDISWMKYYYCWKSKGTPMLRENPALFTKAYQTMVEALINIRTNHEAHIADVIKDDSPYNSLHMYLEHESDKAQIALCNSMWENEAIHIAKEKIEESPEYEDHPLFPEMKPRKEIESEIITYYEMKNDFTLEEKSKTIGELYIMNEEKIYFDESIDFLFKQLCYENYGKELTDQLCSDYDTYLQSFKDSSANRIDFDQAARAHKEAVYAELGISKTDLAALV